MACRYNPLDANVFIMGYHFDQFLSQLGWQVSKEVVQCTSLMMGAGRRIGMSVVRLDGTGLACVLQGNK